MGGRRHRDGVTLVLMGAGRLLASLGSAAVVKAGSAVGIAKSGWSWECLGVSGIKLARWGKPEGRSSSQFTHQHQPKHSSGGDDSLVPGKHTTGRPTISICIAFRSDTLLFRNHQRGAPTQMVPPIRSRVLHPTNPTDFAFLKSNFQSGGTPLLADDRNERHHHLDTGRSVMWRQRIHLVFPKSIEFLGHMAPVRQLQSQRDRTRPSAGPVHTLSTHRASVSATHIVPNFGGRGSSIET